MKIMFGISNNWEYEFDDIERFPNMLSTSLYRFIQHNKHIKDYELIESLILSDIKENQIIALGIIKNIEE